MSMTLEERLRAYARELGDDPRVLRRVGTEISENNCFIAGPCAMTERNLVVEDEEAD